MTGGKKVSPIGTHRETRSLARGISLAERSSVNSKGKQTFKKTNDHAERATERTAPRGPPFNTIHGKEKS